MRLRYIYTALATLCLSITASAQNLDPTVNVTRNYEGKLLEVDKPLQQVNVPDSITRFKLDFGYSVLGHKYSGSYEFVPYVLDMQPDPDAYRENRLWLRAGAGYSLHPTFDAVWSPRISDKFRMSVYGHHRSYVGRYRELDLAASSGSAKDAWASVRDSDGKRVTSSGYDLYSRLGANGRYDWMGGTFSFDASYLDIATRESVFSTRNYARHYDAMNLGFRARSVRDDASYFYWDAALGMRYGVDNLGAMENPMLSGFGGRVGEFLLSIDTRFGQILRYAHGFFLDLDMNVVSYGRSLNSNAEQIVLTPKYRYCIPRLNVEAGVRLDMTFAPKENIIMAAAPMNSGRSRQFIYPDVRVDWAAIEDYMDVYAVIDGGRGINPYSEMLQSRHHFSPVYYNGHPLIDNSIKSVGTTVGLRGNMFARFSYDLSGGWQRNARGVLDSLYADSEGRTMPGLAFLAYQSAFASLKLGLETQDVELKAWMDYRWTNLLKKGQESTGYSGIVEPARFVGGMKATYNWKHRIFAGVSCEGGVNRRVIGSTSVIPWYADLGLNFEYCFKNGLSVWAEGGNLLNQTIQRELGYSENGANFTLGISFTL